MNRIAAALFVTAALAAAPAIGSAQPRQDFAARVKTSDLNLSTEQGAKTALERVRRAALGACTDFTVGSRIGHQDNECVAKVSAELVRRINAPMVQAAFEATLTKG
ncbi:MAG TPA: UrcA family protein [Caulobacteraceae bacterium]|nr:UrcA family protein [Caulobacteraceae bacterium]